MREYFESKYDRLLDLAYGEPVDHEERDECFRDTTGEAVGRYVEDWWSSIHSMAVLSDSVAETYDKESSATWIPITQRR